MQNKAMLADNARAGATKDRHESVKKLWPTHAGPNVLAWSYKDADPRCDTVYTVFCAHPGGKPRLQLAFSDGNYSQMPVQAPERFGSWSTPREFKAWAQAWYAAGTEEDSPRS